MLAMDESRLRPELIPRHVAIIMDGNGRWAERRGISRGWRDTAPGLESCREPSSAPLSDLSGSDHLTLYAFSLENWNRPKDGGEREPHESARDHYLDEELEEVMRNDIRVRAIGRNDRLPTAFGAHTRARAAIERTRDEPRDDAGLRALLRRPSRDRRCGAQARCTTSKSGKIDPDRASTRRYLRGSYLYAPDAPRPGSC